MAAAAHHRHRLAPPRHLATKVTGQEHAHSVAEHKQIQIAQVVLFWKSQGQQHMIGGQGREEAGVVRAGAVSMP